MIQGYEKGYRVRRFLRIRGTRGTGYEGYRTPIFFGTPPLEVQTGKRGTVKRKARILIIIQAKNENFCVTRFFAIAIAIFEISIFCYILHSDMEKIVMQCVRDILNDNP